MTTKNEKTFEDYINLLSCKFQDLNDQIEALGEVIKQYRYVLSKYQEREKTIINLYRAFDEKRDGALEELCDYLDHLSNYIDYHGFQPDKINL